MTTWNSKLSENRSLSWGFLLLLRVAVCLFIGYLYRYTQWQILPWVMIALAIVSMKTISARSPLTVAITLVIVLHFLWVLVIYICSALDVMPVMYSPPRWFVFNAGHLGAVMIGASQMLYLLTLALIGLPRDIEFTYQENPLIAWALLGSAALVSFFINRTSFTLSGNYAGNVNEYWSGLPAIFIIFISAWCLFYKRPSILFLIFLNIIILYWISTGNRSEVLAVFVFGNVAYVISSPIFKSPRLRNIALALVIMLGFLIFTLVGIIRGESDSGSGQSLITSVFGQMVQEDRISVSTVGSSVYSGLVAYHIYIKDGLYYGQTIFGQFLNIIPSFLETPWGRYENPYFSYSTFYQTMGGFGILGESFLNFGIFGPIMFGSFFAWILRCLAIRAPHSFFYSWFLLAFSIYSQRFFYYGYVYLHNMIILFAVIGFFFWVTRRSSRKWQTA